MKWWVIVQQLYVKAEGGEQNLEDNLSLNWDTAIGEYKYMYINTHYTNLCVHYSLDKC